MNHRKSLRRRLRSERTLPFEFVIIIMDLVASTVLSYFWLDGNNGPTLLVLGAPVLILSIVGLAICLYRRNADSCFRGKMKKPQGALADLE